MNASNRCCQCQHEWTDRPTGYARHDACPRCGSPYWEWLDYEDPASVPRRRAEDPSAA